MYSIVSITDQREGQKFREVLLKLITYKSQNSHGFSRYSYRISCNYKTYNQSLMFPHQQQTGDCHILILYMLHSAKLAVDL